MRFVPRLSSYARGVAQAAILAFATASLSCAVGSGTGSVRGDPLVVQDCNDKELSGYDMEPEFFGAVSVQDQLLIRIQRGGDIQEYQDSLTIAIEDTKKVVDGQAITVELQRPNGSQPAVPYPLARISLSLRGTCGSGRVGRSDNPQVVLHAVSGTITFKSILRGDPNSSDTNSKRIDGTFDVKVEDPRHPAGTEARNVGRIVGDFHFFYQRGGPAQPFP